MRRFRTLGWPRLVRADPWLLGHLLGHPLLLLLCGLALPVSIVGQSTSFALPSGAVLEEAFRAETRLHSDGRFDLWVLARSPEVLPSTWTDGSSGGASPLLLEDGGLQVARPGLSEAELLRALGDLRELESALHLRLYLPPGGSMTDIWGLQAALSQVGIRRVQIVLPETP